MRLDKRFAIKPQSKRDTVVKFFNSGWSPTRIAKRYNVAVTTILRIVDPSFREESNERSLQVNRINPTSAEDKERHREEYKLSRKEREPQIKRHYAMGLTQNA